MKPPQNPVIRNTFIEGDITFDLSARPKNIPITKLPITLTEKVPQGKADEVTAWKNFPVRKRRQVPMKPPSPAIIIALNIVLSSFFRKYTKQSQIRCRRRGARAAGRVACDLFHKYRNDGQKQ